MASAASSRSVQILLLICTCFLLPLSLAAQGADDKNSVQLVDSKFSFSFDFTNASSYQAGDLRLEGNASVESNRVDLTCHSRGSIHRCKGRMSYNDPVTFYDDTGALASFSTSFTFVILAENDDSAGDGLAFFLSDYPFKMIPDSEGGRLGLLSETTLPSQSQPFVAVEFDTFQNDWDPSAKHIGVDISSIRSSNYTNVTTNGLNGTMTAKVQFDNTTNMLLASLWFDHHPDIKPVVVTYVLTDPKSLLPGQVEVGFSSTTGLATELHQILAWSFNSTLPAPSPHKDNSSKEEDIGYVEPEQLNLAVLRDATDNFSEENKLGEGGFGEVFKGTLQDGEEIAVKRLSQNSSQGFQELKNELVLAAKLQHRNLVRLLGVSLQEEKLVIYEYMPNRSLDTFLSDPVKRQQLDWSKRFSIICGIARGLLYLHEESRLKVIHRDLKPSNVLLDAKMNPKISDFGIARAFGGDQTRDITRRPVGTLGYMSPEYAYWGHVSTKSDIFSFGVIVLEIVTGRKNNSAYNDNSDSTSVLGHVWDKWRAGSMVDVVDTSLVESGYPERELLNCIEIGLLCVQENPADRPDASAVVLMLSSPTSTSDDRRAPSRPAFVFSSGFTESDHPSRSSVKISDGVPLINGKQSSTTTVSENEMSISELQPR
ncbi:hypothetical protein SEVIR_6G030900v4 [Setaria viridis]|uniref:cysteine-rich receptor-like protein kinase 6 isoform X2 n=1 Tax=Setaria viridis TaxID=4556 RepID=UPI001493BD8B|nr:cysteine-rich receptor-like protein kinase 10 isoform X2 [Setaria viridis]